MLHCCEMLPMTVPGGLDTSISWKSIIKVNELSFSSPIQTVKKVLEGVNTNILEVGIIESKFLVLKNVSTWRQQGKQHSWHRSGLLRWITSCPIKSVMFMSKHLMRVKIWTSFMNQNKCPPSRTTTVSSTAVRVLSSLVNL